jgi:hypothetical protein
MSWTAAPRLDSTAIPEPECTSPELAAAPATHWAAFASCWLVNAIPTVAEAELTVAGNELSGATDAGADEPVGTGAAQAVSTIPATGNASNPRESPAWEIQSRPCLMIINYPTRPQLVPRMLRASGSTNIRYSAEE